MFRGGRGQSRRTTMATNKRMYKQTNELTNRMPKEQKGERTEGLLTKRNKRMNKEGMNEGIQRAKRPSRV